MLEEFEIFRKRTNYDHDDQDDQDDQDDCLRDSGKVQPVGVMTCQGLEEEC